MIVPAVAGECKGYNIETVTIMRFSVVYGGAKGRVVSTCYHQLVPTRRGLYQGYEK